MFLSRVQLEEKNRQLIKDLNHLGAYHNWVEQSFPEEVQSENRSRKLWRIDKLNGNKYLLIVSEQRPDLTILEKYGVSSTAETKSYIEFLNQLEENSRARFKITLNPVISKSAGKHSGERGRVMPHVTQYHQKEYLIKRSLKNGFNLNEGEFYISERTTEILRKKNHQSIKLIKVSYEGILTIVDIHKFRDTLTKGFGKKKAYGFGMMTIIPVTST